MLFDAGVAATAAVLVGSVLTRSPQLPSWPLWAAVPTVLLMARWPVVLLRDTSGIEIGLDSAVLMFLAFAAPRPAAVTVWTVGCVASQLMTRKSASTRLFNVGVTILAGMAAIGAVAALRAVPAPGPRDLLAAAAGAVAYFGVDYLLSAASVALVGRTGLGAALWDPNTPISAACFAGVAALGYLGAVVVRYQPWTLPLLAVPAGTLVLAAKAFAAAHADRVRVRGLFDAAAASQRGDTEAEIVAALVEQGCRVLRCPAIRIADRPGAAGELAVALPRAAGQRARWLVAAPRLTGVPFSAEDGHALDALAAIAAESLQRADLVAELARRARRDPLTGLANRAVFRARLAQALAGAPAGGRPAVLFCDLDGFKAVNDSHGHATGDAVLVAVALRFLGCVRDEDVVARLGGDEFAVLLPETDTDTALAVADRLLEAAAEPVLAADRHVGISASIGVSPGDVVAAGTDPDFLLRAADVAMYAAKAAGKNRRALFEESMLARFEPAPPADHRPGPASRGERVAVHPPALDLLTG